MKSDFKILTAFVLNLLFSIAEFIGGAFTGSVAIISDAVHDLGDCVSIGVSYILEKISKKKPDSSYTFGYVRYSVFGSLIQTVILISGSVIVIYNAVLRLINPTPINYNGMIILALFGAVINFAGAVFTHGGKSLNQKAVSLHMLEDVLGWIVVLLGAVVMKFTDIKIIDPVLSIGVALISLFYAIKIFGASVDILLEKTPKNVSLEEMYEHLKQIHGVIDAHHLHIWSFDGISNAATVHIVTDSDAHNIKKAVKEEFAEHSISHVTVEIEAKDEHCHDTECNPTMSVESGHHHHHH